MDISRYLKPRESLLLLEDGTEFYGWRFGGEQSGFGEVVFNTSMTGYQEVLTDPSYWQQIVVMTYPHQGNYGVNQNDIESTGGIKVSGFIVHELCDQPSNFASEESLDRYFKKASIAGLTGVDTRALTLHIRSQGAMRGLIMSQDERRQFKSAAEAFARRPKYSGRNLIEEVTTKKPYWFSEKGSRTVVAIDYGVKLNLLREIARRDCKVVVVPASTSFSEILAYRPDGVFLSNGPGDPAVATKSISVIRELLGKVPIFGVCMGHQLLALALGGRTYKMKFGHRGANQPVFCKGEKRVEISSHNHGYAVDSSSLPKEVVVSHCNLNDQVCEGIECLSMQCFSVQYHPESAPGPHDSEYLFDRFVHLMKG